MLLERADDDLLTVERAGGREGIVRGWRGGDGERRGPVRFLGISRDSGEE
jgi:hypothetical protein